MHYPAYNFNYDKMSVSFTVSLTDSVGCQVCHLQAEPGGFGWVREAGKDWGEFEDVDRLFG